MDKIATITHMLDSIADEVEKEDPRIALAIDKISDLLEKKAYFNQTTWLPGRASRDYPISNYPSQRRDEAYASAVCSNCYASVRVPRGAMACCPRCGSAIRG